MATVLLNDEADSAMGTKILPLILLAGLTAFLPAQPAEEKPIWHEDWLSAQRAAKAANKPIFAVLVCKH